MSSAVDTRRPPAGPPDHLEADEPELRLSWSRLGILVLVLALIVGGVYWGVREVTTTTTPTARSWSIPYVDVTLTPTYEFQNPQVNPARDIALAFVVAHPDEACEPAWGGAYTLDEAGDQLELDRRISQLRDAGGDIMVSFGGQANRELAFACTSDDRLADAYREVIERYDVRAIDLDIEGEAVADTASIERRARAIATIQQERKAAGDGELAVWLTLPVATSGLTGEGQSVVAATLDGGVTLAGVNVMTMNFDATRPTDDMLAASRSALEATARQLGDIYGRRGISLDEPQRWARLGATPMIGQNDVAGEVFTLDDAAGLAAFAVDKGLGRVSIWSLNRDAQCGASFTDVVVLSNTCSSVQQDALAFANVFSGLPGRAAYLPQDDSQTVTVSVPDRQPGVDDPARSPYPVWRPEAQYPEGYKVVRRGTVYEAKWFTEGDDPSMVVPNPWDTPWTLIGPVSPDDEPFVPTTLAPGTYPEWDHEHLYVAGDRVLFLGLPYVARWSNQGDVPSTLLPVPVDSPWDPLYDVPGEPRG